MNYPIDKKVESLRNLNGPVFDLEARNHAFQDIERSVAELKNLNYPVYDINREHRFNEIQKNLYDLKQMNGPVFDIEHHHAYQEFNKNIADLKALVGPVYDIPNYKHHFAGIEAHVNDLKSLAGPVYSTESNHCFAEINHFMADLKNLNYPVLQIENNHSFQGVIKNIDKLHKLQAPHYDVPSREHHFAEIWRHVSDLKQMVGPVYEAETKHNYQGPEPHQEDLSSEVGPVYRVERRHSFQKGFSCEIDKKTVKGPVYAVEHRHQYEQGFSCKERPPSPTPGPVRGGDRQGRHNYKHPITLKRGNRSKSVGFEVNSAEDFKEKETRSDDRKELVGPIYSTGKIADERVHHFTQGYQAPMSAEQKAEKMRLIKKHFEKQQKAMGSLHEKVVSKVVSLQQQTEVRSHSESRVSREEALRLGENRRQEAVQRRQQFLQQERAGRQCLKGTGWPRSRRGSWCSKKIRRWRRVGVRGKFARLGNSQAASSKPGQRRSKQLNRSSRSAKHGCNNKAKDNPIRRTRWKEPQWTTAENPVVRTGRRLRRLLAD